MFSPVETLTISGEILGVNIDVVINVGAEDITASAQDNEATVVGVHNIGTMLLIAVNGVLKRLEEQENGGFTSGPARIVNIADMKKMLEGKGH